MEGAGEQARLAPPPGDLVSRAKGRLGRNQEVFQARCRRAVPAARRWAHVHMRKIPGHQGVGKDGAGSFEAGLGAVKALPAT